MFLFRTPVRWLKFRPEKPMGEIQEEGDKDDGEKLECGEGEEGAEKVPSEKKDGGTDEATAVKEVQTDSVNQGLVKAILKFSLFITM